MGRLRTPWTSQPPLGTDIDPYWLARGLQLVFDGQRVVWNRKSGALQPRTLGGTPKTRKGPKGLVTGIGATYGTGTTDRIDSGTLDSPKTGMRSVVANLFVNGQGGGNLGRVFQSTSGSGIANVGDEALYLNGGGLLFARQTSTLTGASYTTGTAFPTGRWATYGISFLGDYPTNTLPMVLIDGIFQTSITATQLAGAAFTAGTSMAMSWGNRSSDSARGFDGMIGPVLIFDGYLSEAEHRRLAENPWQVFAPIKRNLFFGVPAVGGQTLSPNLLSNTNSFFAPTVTPGDVTLSPGLFSNTNSFFSPTVNLDTNQTLTPSLLSNTNSFFAPTVTPGAVTLVPSLLSNTNSFFAPTVYFPVELHDDHERSNADLTLSSIVQDSYAPTIAIYPRLQLSDSYGNPAYEFFHARVTGVLGKRPNFKVRYYLTPSTHPLDAWGFQTTQRFMYSYDQVTWYYFDTHAASGDNLNIDFKLNADFTGDTVYVASQRPFTGTMVSAMVASMASTYPSYVSMPPSSAGNAYVAGTIGTQTDERGRTIPAQDFYSMRITDDSQQPSDGSPKRIAVLIAGQHASEDVGNWMLRGAIEFLCSADAKAVDARKNFVFYVYPHVNPMGRYGGHWRGDFNAAHPTYDGNRRWITTPNMECVTKHKDAITTDLAGRQIALWLDYHGGYSGYFLYSGSPLYSQYQTKMLAYQAGITIFDVNPTNSSTYYADNTLGADLATPVEASRDLQLTEAQILTYGGYSIKALVDLYADSSWPVLVPARFDNSNTFFAPTITTGAVTLAPSLFTNTNTFYSPVVTLDTDQVLVPARLDNTNTFFAQTITTGEVTLVPDRLENTNQFFAATVTPGVIVLEPDRLDNTNEFYGPAVTVGDVTLEPPFFTNVNQFYTAIVSGVAYPTVGRPISDTSNTGWLPSTGVDLYPMVDEVVPDALDYIYATSVGAVCELALNPTAYPGTASQEQKFRASSSTGNSLIVRIKNGATTIRSHIQALTPVDTEYTITLTSGEIAAITSGSLSVELESA